MTDPVGGALPEQQRPEELKPCPFCGERPHCEDFDPEDEDGDAPFVECRSCDFSIIGLTLRQAKKRWNARRVSSGTANPQPDLERLRAIAEKATPGPWFASHWQEGIWRVGTEQGQDGIAPGGYHYGETPVGPEQCDAEHIAAFSPSVCLSLLDEIQRLRGSAPPADQPPSAKCPECGSGEPVVSPEPPVSALLSQVFNLIGEAHPEVDLDTPEIAKRLPAVYAALRMVEVGADRFIAETLEESRKQVAPLVEEIRKGERVTGEILNTVLRSESARPAPAPTSKEAAWQEERRVVVELLHNYADDPHHVCLCIAAHLGEDVAGLSAPLQRPSEEETLAIEIYHAFQMAHDLAYSWDSHPSEEERNRWRFVARRISGLGSPSASSEPPKLLTEDEHEALDWWLANPESSEVNLQVVACIVRKVIEGVARGSSLPTEGSRVSPPTDTKGPK